MNTFNATSNPVSELDDERTTSTPARVMKLAQLAVKSIRSHLKGSRISAAITPVERTLILHLTDERNADCGVALSIGTPYDIDSVLSEMALSRKVTFLKMPDEPESIHVVGIILDAISPVALSIVLRKTEQNQAVWRLRPRSAEFAPQIDLCDYFISGPMTKRPPPEHEVACILTSTHCFTPIEVFNWAARSVKRVRRVLKGRKITASLWGYRSNVLLMHRDDPSITTGPTRSNNHPHMAVELRDEYGKRLTFRFYKGRHNLADINVAVPDFMQGLHMISLVLNTLGAELVAVGSHDKETNWDVLRRVPELGSSYGRRVPATNFVMPLAVEEGV